MSYRDYEEFLESFNAHGVRYLVIGAHAVAFHARPRATKDLDLYIEPSEENARRVLTAIRHFFGGADLGFTVQDLTDPDVVVQLGIAPARIDLFSELSALRDFSEAWKKRIEAQFGTVTACYLSLEDLITEKESTGRDQDRVDVGILRAAQERG